MRAEDEIEAGGHSPEARLRSPWQAVLVISTLATVLVLVVLMVVQGGLIPPVAIFALLALIGLGLLRVRERAGVIMLAVISILFLALNAVFIVPSLSVPESTVDFLVSALTVLSLVGMIVSSIALFRRKTGEVAMRFLGGVCVLALIAVAVATVARLGYEAAEAQPGDIRLATQNFEFSPGSLETAEGEVSVFIDNQDTVLHTFTIEELDVNVTIPGGGSARATFTATPGSYEFICEPHQPDMDGTLEVGGPGPN